MLLLRIPKISHWFLVNFSQKLSFQDYFGSEPRILNVWCGKTTLRERMCPVWLHVIYMGNFLGPAEVNNYVTRTCAGTLDRGFIVLAKWHCIIKDLLIYLFTFYLLTYLYLKEDAPSLNLALNVLWYSLSSNFLRLCFFLFCSLPLYFLYLNSKDSHNHMMVWPNICPSLVPYTREWFVPVPTYTYVVYLVFHLLVFVRGYPCYLMTISVWENRATNNKAVFPTKLNQQLSVFIFIYTRQDLLTYLLFTYLLTHPLTHSLHGTESFLRS